MGDPPKWVKSKRRRKKRRRKKEERLNDGDNNGQAKHGAHKHAWRTQAAWANNLDKPIKLKLRKSSIKYDHGVLNQVTLATIKLNSPSLLAAINTRA